MAPQKISAFEIVLLIVGVAAAFLGFQMINQVYIQENELSWLMVIAIFNWLMLLVLFVSLSLTVDTSKKAHAEIKNLVELMKKKKR